MGEKGNLLDMGEDVFANLAEQGPQFWIAYKQYQLARDKGDKGDQTRVTAPAAPRASAYDPADEGAGHPAGG
jgi:hypothetical protein